MIDEPEEREEDRRPWSKVDHISHDNSILPELHTHLSIWIDVYVHNQNHILCSYFFRKPNMHLFNWFYLDLCTTQEEDQKILELVAQHGLKKWAVVGSNLQGHFFFVEYETCSCRAHWKAMPRTMAQPPQSW